MDDLTSQQPPAKKRRARISTSPDSDDGKRRGRPRVEKQDESAADRRRTQIRMAQRAYRQRKESTLDELRKRVSELSNTMELMNKAFLSCRDQLSTLQLPSQQSNTLRETAAQYENLMRCVRNPGDEGELSEPINSSTSTAPVLSSPIPSQASLQQNITPTAEPRNISTWMDQTVLQHPPDVHPLPDIGMGYRMLPADSNNRADTPLTYFNTATQHNQHSMTHMQSHLSNQNYYNFRVQVPEEPILTKPTVSAELPLPTTYSFQETTFARRLHRATLEAAYHLLSDPERAPLAYEHVFRLSLMGRDLNRLRKCMVEILNRGTDEPLDLWTAPLIHVGGAGTHYPHFDRDGKMIPRKESYNIGIIGPQTLALLENASRDHISTDMTVSIAGFEGEWLDPYDVEGYLAERNIFIDPTLSFAEADLIITPSTSSHGSITTLSDNADSPLTPPPPRNMSNAPSLNHNFTPVDEVSGLDMTGVGYSDASTGSWMNFLPPRSIVVASSPKLELNTADTKLGWNAPIVNTQDYFSMTPENAMMHMQVPVQEKKHILLDVTKFIQALTISAVCLGRTPGYRRENVDRAIEIASFSASD